MDLSQRVGVNWDDLIVDVRDKEYERLQEHISASLALSNVHYRIILRSLDEFVFQKVSLAERVDFLVSALRRVPRTSQHLYLQLITPACAKLDRPDLRAEAATMFQLFAAEVHANATVASIESARIAVKLAAAMKLTEAEIGRGAGGLRPLFERLLDASRTQAKALAPALALLTQFPEIVHDEEKEALLVQAASCGKHEEMMSMAAQLPRASQERIVGTLVTIGELKAAAAAVCVLDLAAVFPDVETRYQEQVVAKLLGKGKWSLAAAFVGDSTSLQRDVRAAGLSPVTLVCVTLKCLKLATG